MAKKKEETPSLTPAIEQAKQDYLEYQNKVTGNDISEPLIFSHIVSGLQKDILNIYNILIELSKK